MQGQNKGFVESNIDIIIPVFLFLAISILYFQLHSYQFISFDDPLYVVDNQQVHKGLTLESISWAFSLSKQGEVTNWHPLTWISHMLDYELFGLNAGMHHLMSVFLHILCTILLYLALRWMTGSVWKSAFVASLFALHPVNVDSVAWIAERKNVLSTVFWMLTMIAYFYYARKPGIGAYLMIVAALCLGSLAKQMLMTLPFVLLLLDYWPLGRVQIPAKGSDRKDWSLFYRRSWRLVLEKLPLLLISFAFFYSTILSLKYSKTIMATSIVPMDLKIKNAIVSYILYMWKMIWPVNLSVFYPYPDAVPMWQVMGVVAILLLITAAALLKYRKYPYFIVGWLWFLGTLVPVLGIIQAGLWPAIGERWAYIPYIGLFIILAWGVPDLLARVPRKREILTAAASVILILFAVKTWLQIGYWKDDFSLFSESLASDPDNYVAHVNIGVAYAKQENYEQALHHLEEAVRIHSNDIVALDGLARVYGKLGQYDRSIQYYREILRFNPENSKAHYDLGSIYVAKGDLNNAFTQFSKVVRLNPNDALSYYYLGIISAKKGNMNEAVEYLSTTLKLNPNDAESHCTLGVVLMNQGKVEEAVAHFQDALEIDPGSSAARAYLNSARDYEKKTGRKTGLEQKKMKESDDPESLKRLAVLYSSRGEHEKALEVLYSLVRNQPDNPDGYYNIACVLAKEGKVEKSVEWLKKSVGKGFKDWGLLQKDKDLDNIRMTEYYRELVKDKK